MSDRFEYSMIRYINNFYALRILKYRLVNSCVINLRARQILSFSWNVFKNIKTFFRTVNLIESLRKLLIEKNIIFAEALKAYGGRLTEYERAEVDKFPEVWFLGLDAAKVLGRPGAPLNSGYDDDNGSYNKVSEIIKKKILLFLIPFHIFESEYRKINHYVTSYIIQLKINYSPRVNNLKHNLFKRVMKFIFTCIHSWD